MTGKVAFIEKATDTAYQPMTPGHDRDDIRIDIVIDIDIVNASD
ncbi:hypothetical protein [Streptomyces fradiae]